VLAERANAVRDARAARVADGTLTMAEVVDERLADQGVTEADWDAWRNADGRWAVQLVYRAYDRLHSASWIWDAASRRVTATDAPAQSLLRGVPVVEPDSPTRSGAAVVFGLDTNASPVRAVPDPAPETDTQTQIPMPEPTGPRGVPYRAGGRSGRRAAIPSWTQIRESAGMPSNSDGE
jgi:hypothetical protein